ncbi:MAG TPA: hypothetical protein VF487_00640 [Chitinophagaceae bacterium]
MKDSAICRVQTANIIQSGHRVYYYNCHREGRSGFNWYSNNLPAAVAVNDITVNWVFNKQWKPEMN